jgi:O-antigen/teichoic acid export membrane protein
LIFAFGLSISSHFLLRLLVGKDFQKAASIIVWISLGYAFDGMYYMVTNYIFYSYKTYLLAVITLISGILNILMTLFLVEINNMVGAAQAFMISYFFQFLFTWIVSAKVYQMPWRIL